MEWADSAVGFPPLQKPAAGQSQLYLKKWILGMFPRPNQLLSLVLFECRSMSQSPSQSIPPSVLALRFGTLSTPPTSGDVSHAGVQWLLKRNCSVTPAQLLGLFMSLSVVSLGIATFFWFQGATLVMPFAWLELVVVGVAFLVYARHARDGEKISLQGGQLVVEQEIAGRTQRAEFNREWVRVEPQDGDGSLIEVSGQGRKVRVGRHVRPELRPALAREIRYALRGC
jgi:uncharacterized membrane protein